MAAQLVSSSTLQVASAALRSPFAMICSLAAVAAHRRGRTGACWGLGKSIRHLGSHKCLAYNKVDSSLFCDSDLWEYLSVQILAKIVRNDRKSIPKTNLWCPGGDLHVCRTNVAMIC